jgi:hypothetical protein
MTRRVQRMATRANSSQDSETRSETSRCVRDNTYIDLVIYPLWHWHAGEIGPYSTDLIFFYTKRPVGSSFCKHPHVDWVPSVPRFTCGLLEQHATLVFCRHDGRDTRFATKKRPRFDSNQNDSQTRSRDFSHPQKAGTVSQSVAISKRGDNER